VFGKRLCAADQLPLSGFYLLARESRVVCIDELLFYFRTGTAVPAKKGLGGFEISDDDRGRTWTGRWAACTSVFRRQAVMAEALASIQPQPARLTLRGIMQACLEYERQMQLVQRGCDHKVVSARRAGQVANQVGTAADWIQPGRKGNCVGDILLAAGIR